MKKRLIDFFEEVPKYEFSAECDEKVLLAMDEVGGYYIYEMSCEYVDDDWTWIIRVVDENNSVLGVSFRWDNVPTFSINRRIDSLGLLRILPLFAIEE
jgi:hypothetical protein